MSVCVCCGDAGLTALGRSHEWGKHGTCCSDNQSLNSQLGFFSSTVSLLGKYNVTSAFAAAGISPGNSYDKTKMSDAISKAFSANAALDCTSGELSAVSFCIGKDLTVQTCPSNVGTGSCGSSVNF